MSDNKFDEMAEIHILMYPEMVRALDRNKSTYGHIKRGPFLRYIINDFFKKEGIEISKYTREIENE